MSKNCGPKFCNVGSNFSMEWQRKSSMGVKQNVILQILSVGGTVVEMDGDEMTRLVLIYVVGYFIFLLARQSETESVPIISISHEKEMLHQNLSQYVLFSYYYGDE